MAEGIDPLDCAGGARRLLNRLKAMLLEGIWKDADREKVSRILDWPEETAERLEAEAWESAQQTMAAMGIQLDFDSWADMPVAGRGLVDTDGMQGPA